MLYESLKEYSRKMMEIFLKRLLIQIKKTAWVSYPCSYFYTKVSYDNYGPVVEVAAKRLRRFWAAC